METDRATAIAMIRERGVLNRFSTPADDWFVAASEHQENSDNPDDFIDYSLGLELVGDDTVALMQESDEDSTRCWTYRLT